MAQPEVFRPSNGPLLVRTNMDCGSGTDFYKKSHPLRASEPVYQRPSMSRPSTQGGYRFGQLSRNAFFTRHNPHPLRVSHIKGLLDVPICAVNDGGFFASPRYSLTFPPNNFNETKIETWRGKTMPVNAINVNSHLHPVNTMTGLDYFTGLKSGPFREKAVPQMGMVPMTGTWRDELRAITEAAGLLPKEDLTQMMAPQVEGRDDLPRQHTATRYSMQTGRIIPPPSRAMSRQASKNCWRNQWGMQPQHIVQEPDNENMVLGMLCQILQTDDINAVQTWLCNSGDREKNIVLDLIKTAVENKDDYYKHNPEDTLNHPHERPKTMTLPAITENNFVVDQGNGAVPAQVDRLTLDDPHTPHPQQATIAVPDDGNNWSRCSWTPMRNAAMGLEGVVPRTAFSHVQEVPDTEHFEIKPPISDPFKKSPVEVALEAERANTRTPMSSMPKHMTAEKPGTAQKPGTVASQARLRYTKTPLHEEQDHVVEEEEWVPGLSTNI